MRAIACPGSRISVTITRETERDRKREMKKSEHASKKPRTVPLVVFVLYMQYAWNSTLSSMMI